MEHFECESCGAERAVSEDAAPSVNVPEVCCERAMNFVGIWEER